MKYKFKPESRHGYPRVLDLPAMRFLSDEICLSKNTIYPAAEIESSSHVSIPSRAANLGLPSKLPLQMQITPSSSSSPTKLGRTPIRTIILTFVL